MRFYAGQDLMIISPPKPNTTRVTALPMTSTGEDDKRGLSSKRVAVIGAGVSGLSAAYKLKLHGLNVTVFEADGRCGGKLRSVSHGGLIWDEGANTMTETEPSVGFLLDSLGLREKQQFPLSQQKRYITKNGLRSDPIALIRSMFFLQVQSYKYSWSPFCGRIKMFRRDLAQKKVVGAFFQRHFGKEVVDYLIDPFVAGTSGGNPESLSSDAACFSRVMES